MTDTEFRPTVNGAQRSVTCEPDTPLLSLLRQDLGLAGPKFGCGTGLCGARGCSLSAASWSTGPTLRRSAANEGNCSVAVACRISMSMDQ